MAEGADQPENPLVDINSYILSEYVAAKPLECILDVIFNPVKQLSHCDIEDDDYEETMMFPFARENYTPTILSILEAKELVAADEASETKRVVELTLDTAPLGEFSYDPGDTVAIVPCNATKVVEQFLERLDLIEKADSTCQVKLSTTCTKKNPKLPAYIPASTNPREIFTFCVSLNGVPQKQFLSALANCTTDTKEKNFLACLSSKQGAAHYQELILERGLNLLDLLELCASCMPTLTLLTEHLPRLLPRPYSIANSPLECAQQLRIIYSVLDKRPGVTTSMIESKLLLLKHRTAKIFVYPRVQNAFRYTDEDLPSNQILIAVGTALAPFLGFLSHKQLSQPAGTGQTWLYVGAKTPQAMLKQQQLTDWQESSVLQRLRMCYSRSSTDEAEPKYVQELIERDAEELVELLLKPTTVMYVCADGSKISRSIEEAVRGCLQQILKLNEKESKEKLKELRVQGKYREDVWL